MFHFAKTKVATTLCCKLSDEFTIYKNLLKSNDCTEYN